MKYVVLDLMSEPESVPNNSVFTIQTDLIKLLRSKNYTGPILVEGNTWSGLHSWITEACADADGTSYTNATLFTRDNFTKAGITDLSNIYINVHQYLNRNYSGTANTCQSDLRITGPI